MISDEIYAGDSARLNAEPESSANPRCARITRKTRETDITLALTLDGSGKADIDTGIGFFDHMLEALCRFGLMDIDLRCAGDLRVDAHHTMEDCGLCLGEALAGSLGDKRGIRRVAHAYVPMDEALAFCALDFSGRPYLVFDAPLAAGQLLGGADAQLYEEFLRALAASARATLHIRATGVNLHHIVEAIMKALGRAIDDAKLADSRVSGVPSTKGLL